MANWRVAARLMMQYNGHLPIQKQTNGHEHVLNQIWAWSFRHKHRKRGCTLGLKGALGLMGPTSVATISEKKGCSMSLQSSESRLEVESDSPPALTAKSCLGHLALTQCLFDRLSAWLTEETPTALHHLLTVLRGMCQNLFFPPKQRLFNSNEKRLCLDCPGI